ncbi:hypothetical protein MDAP_000781 [Mitosporidium daphniae]
MPTEIEELRGTDLHIPESALKLATPTKDLRLFDDLFSFHMGGDFGQGLEINTVSPQTLFQCTPMKQFDEPLLVNPKLSLDRTLFGASFENDEHLSNVEIVRKSQIPSSPLNTLGEEIKEPLLFGDDGQQLDFFHPDKEISFSPLQAAQSTPIKEVSFTSQGDPAAMFAVPSPIEATRILGSPDVISEIAKILTFGGSVDPSDISESSAENSDGRIRKRHKGSNAPSSTSKTTFGIPLGERKAHLLVNMDLTTELPSTTIQLQLKGASDTLRSIESLTVDLILPIKQVDSFLSELLALGTGFHDHPDISMLDFESKISCKASSPKIDAFSTLADNEIPQRSSTPIGLTNLDMIDDISEATQRELHVADSSPAEDPSEGFCAEIQEIGNISSLDQFASIVSSISPAAEKLNLTQTLQGGDSYCEKLEQILNNFSGPSLSLNTVLSEHCRTRRDVAISFYQVLRLTSLGAITAQQQRPYGEIILSK